MWFLTGNEISDRIWMVFHLRHGKSGSAGNVQIITGRKKVSYLSAGCFTRENEELFAIILNMDRDDTRRCR
jgi:hypothetical protein